MLKSKEKFSTLGGKYIVKESREHIDFISFGSLTLKSAARESFAYSDKSNRFEVMYAPEGGLFSVGEHVWGHHFIYDSPFKDCYATLEDNLWFAGDSPTKATKLKDGMVIFKPLKQTEKASNGIVYELAKEVDLVGVVVDGPLPKGAQITFVKNKEYEMFYGEERYFVVDIEQVTTVNGEPYGEFYACENFLKYQTEIDGLTVFGQEGKIRELGFSKIKRGILCKLHNTKLPHHGKYAVLQKMKDFGKEGADIVGVL